MNETLNALKGWREHRRQLSWCDRCQENTVKTKVYRRKTDGALIRAWICTNAGHGLIETQVLEKGGLSETLLP